MIKPMPATWVVKDSFTNAKISPPTQPMDLALPYNIDCSGKNTAVISSRLSPASSNTVCGW
ncbi:hypothetical protein D3C78_1997590 [compost metagenome]